MFHTGNYRFPKREMRSTDKICTLAQGYMYNAQKIELSVLVILPLFGLVTNKLLPTDFCFLVTTPTKARRGKSFFR